MTMLRKLSMMICCFALAAPALGQHAHRDRGGPQQQRQFMPPPGQRVGNPPGPPARPVGSLTKEERQELNRDLNQANREIDQQRGRRR